MIVVFLSKLFISIFFCWNLYLIRDSNTKCVLFMVSFRVCTCNYLSLKWIFWKSTIWAITILLTQIFTLHRFVFFLLFPSLSSFTQTNLRKLFSSYDTDWFKALNVELLDVYRTLCWMIVAVLRFYTLQVAIEWPIKCYYQLVHTHEL